MGKRTSDSDRREGRRTAEARKLRRALNAIALAVVRKELTYDQAMEREHGPDLLREK